MPTPNVVTKNVASDPLLAARAWRLIIDGAVPHPVQLNSTGGRARELARPFAPALRLTATDRSRTMMAESRRRCHGLRLPVACCVGDVEDLPFADVTFDGCYAVGIFETPEQPRRALEEMIRVLRPGDRLALVVADELAASLSEGRPCPSVGSGPSPNSFADFGDGRDRHGAAQLRAARSRGAPRCRGLPAGDATAGACLALSTLGRRPSRRAGQRRDTARRPDAEPITVA